MDLKESGDSSRHYNVVEVKYQLLCLRVDTWSLLHLKPLFSYTQTRGPDEGTNDMPSPTTEVERRSVKKESWGSGLPDYALAHLLYPFCVVARTCVLRESVRVRSGTGQTEEREDSKED